MFDSKLTGIFIFFASNLNSKNNDIALQSLELFIGRQM